jgi:SAM-dependent methyltransferase
MIAAFQGIAAVTRLLPTLEQAFRSGEGIAWRDHDAEFFEVQERFSRPLQRQFLIDVWLIAVPGLIDRLGAGASVADVGCGYGTSTLLLADAFPRSRFHGFDFHDVSVAHARRSARDRGMAERAQFEIADARSFPGSGYDAVLFVDCLHDMADPVAAARHARGALAPGGVVVAIDPVAADTLAENLRSPMAGLQYAISTFLCTPTALAQHGPYALGAMAGEAALVRVLRDAGFSDVQRVAPEAPMNMVLVARA